MESEFDYEGATWGAETIRPGERSIAGYRLDEALRFFPAEGRAIEIGCGAGRFLRALAAARPGLHYVGSDISRSALARLREIAPGLETRLAEGNRFPAGDAEFDAVMMLDVLEHVTDPATVLDEVVRVLKPGGLYHLHVPCEADPRCLWRWLPGQAGERGLKWRFGGHIQRFRRGEMLAELRGRGFEILRVRHSLHLLGNLADVAAFAWLDVLERRGQTATTGDLVAEGSGAVRLVDAALWAEARLLGRVPSWALHVSMRKPA